MLVRENRGMYRCRLVECPVCGVDLTEYPCTWMHFLEDHRPEDFGLSPLDESIQNSTSPKLFPDSVIDVEKALLESAPEVSD